MDFPTSFKKIIGLENKKYQIGIALGGGGARGFVHLGVLKALHELGIRPGIISGTSAGALVGALIAAGKDPEEVHELLKSKSLFVYSKLQWLKEGLLSLNGLEKIIRDEISVERIEDLEIPFIVTVSNLNTGKVEYLDKGPLAASVIASSSIPLIFSPIEINGSKYADGGILDNLPISPLLLRCKKVIAVSISPLKEAKQLTGMLKIAFRAFQMSVNAHTDDLLPRCSLFIEPDNIREYDIFDLKKADELFDMGYNYMKNLDQTLIEESLAIKL